MADSGIIHDAPTFVPRMRCGRWLQYRLTVACLTRNFFATCLVVKYGSEKLIDTDMPSTLAPKGINATLSPRTIFLTRPCGLVSVEGAATLATLGSEQGGTYP